MFLFKCHLLKNDFSGREGPWPWPPRSPDLTPVDFFLWGYLKEQIRRNAPNNLDELEACIVQECSKISPQMCQNACPSVLPLVKKCIENCGGHVLYNYH